MKLTEDIPECPEKLDKPKSQMWYFRQTLRAHILGYAGDSSKGGDTSRASKRHVHNENGPLWPACNIKHPRKGSKHGLVPHRKQLEEGLTFQAASQAALHLQDQPGCHSMTEE